MNTMLGRIEEAFADQQASEDRLRRFVADASHELRTPLTSIRGYAELFRRGADRRPDDLATAMRRIEDESARMGRLVEDLLLLARLDEQPALHRAPVDLSALVTDVVADARVSQPGRPIEAEVQGEVVVDGEEGRLRQVVANLVTNALVHTPPDTPVAVRLATDDAMAVVEVADRGPGLRPSEAEHVFERFNRGDPARARATGGTGLGLAIVAALVSAHDGSVDLVTAEGQGATFRVRLPLPAADH
jgi:two-component system OmpR family sensor kinase